MADDLHLTNAEKDLIRREFMTRFGEAQSVKQGFHLKRWATGPLKGQPKLVAAVQSMLDRDLITVIDEGHWPGTAKGGFLESHTDSLGQWP